MKHPSLRPTDILLNSSLLVYPASWATPLVLAMDDPPTTIHEFRCIFYQLPSRTAGKFRKATCANTPLGPHWVEVLPSAFASASLGVARWFYSCRVAWMTQEKYQALWKRRRNHYHRFLMIPQMSKSFENPTSLQTWVNRFWDALIGLQKGLWQNHGNWHHTYVSCLGHTSQTFSSIISRNVKTCIFYLHEVSSIQSASLSGGDRTI